MRPTNHLGPMVVVEDNRGKGGRVRPIRWNPLEGSSNGPGQVATRGNLDYQSMLRTFRNGFYGAGERDDLRDPLPTEADLVEEEDLVPGDQQAGRHAPARRGERSDAARRLVMERDLCDGTIEVFDSEHGAPRVLE